jgi:hypothetical protein
LFALADDLAFVEVLRATVFARFERAVASGFDLLTVRVFPLRLVLDFAAVFDLVSSVFAVLLAEFEVAIILSQCWGAKLGYAPRKGASENSDIDPKYYEKITSYLQDLAWLSGSKSRDSNAVKRHWVPEIRAAPQPKISLTRRELFIRMRVEKT